MEDITSVRRFTKLIYSQREVLWPLYLYSAVASIISLSLPLGIQAIINLIMSGRVTTSFFVLVIIVALGYGLTGYIQILQLNISELLQRRIFTKSTFEFAYRIPRMQLMALRKNYTPELVNRFFDTLTIQKYLPKVLIDFASSGFQIVVGLVLIAFYHPFFIIFGFLSVLLIVGLVYLIGPAGLKTALKESKYKYETAHWLEEIARNIVTFKLAKDSNMPLEKANENTENYLGARARHYKTLLVHYYSLLFFKILISGSFLLIGGLLVINQQMNIGQFVAAEIIIIIILSAVEKLILNIDSVYSILTAIEKIGAVTDIPLDREGSPGLDLSGENGLSIKLDNLSIRFPDAKYNSIHKINLNINSGERVLIVGRSGSGKTTLLQLISGMYEDYTGLIKINEIPLKNINIYNYRSKTGDSIAGETIFEGTILDNITMGRNISINRVIGVLRHLEVLEYMEEQGFYLDSRIITGGMNLSSKMKSAIIFARCIAHRPLLMLHDETAHTVDKIDYPAMLTALLRLPHHYTMIATSNSTRNAHLYERVIFMENGSISSDLPYESACRQQWFKDLN